VPRPEEREAAKAVALDRLIKAVEQIESKAA
jgi:hypothetical protein